MDKTGRLYPKYVRSWRERQLERLENMFPGDPEYDVLLEMLGQVVGCGGILAPTSRAEPQATPHCPECGLIWDDPASAERYRVSKGKLLRCAECRLDISLHR